LLVGLALMVVPGPLLRAFGVVFVLFQEGVVEWVVFVVVVVVCYCVPFYVWIFLIVVSRLWGTQTLILILLLLRDIFIW